MPMMPQMKYFHQASGCARVGEEPLGRDEEPDDRQDRGDVVAAVQGRHRIGVLARLHDEDADDRGEQAEGPGDEREEHDADDAGREGHALLVERGRERGAEDHRADVLGGGGLEEVGAAAGAVADVVADEVGDDGGIARVVLGNAGLDLADEVGADVGRLGVDAAAELREERHERGAEAVADDQEGDLSRRNLREPADEPVAGRRRREGTWRRRRGPRPRRRAAPSGARRSATCGRPKRSGCSSGSTIHMPT